MCHPYLSVIVGPCFKALIMREFEQLMKCTHIEQLYIASSLKQQYI